jgi:hypothetical protein
VRLAVRNKIGREERGWQRKERLAGAVNEEDREKMERNE